MKVIKFEASWCEPCKSLSRLLESVEGKHTGVIEIIDIDEQPDLARQYGVRSVPTIIKFEGPDTEIERKVGMMTESELLAFLA